MKKLFVLTFLLASVGAWAQGHNAEQGKLIAMENLWNAAQRDHDVKALDAMISDDFINTDYDGSFQNKAEFLASMKDPSLKITSMTNENVLVFLHGNTAIVAGGYTAKGTNKGKPFDHKGRFTDTWVLTNGKWQCVASSSQHIER
jgi:ketosteroid isomerase-like protein